MGLEELGAEPITEFGPGLSAQLVAHNLAVRTIV